MLGLLLAAVGAVSLGARTAAAAAFTVVTTDSGVQALRDTKPADW
jgi:hypothetical protein